METATDELKTHLRGAKILLRSKTPELVCQEFYGLLIARLAIRGLMHGAGVFIEDRFNERVNSELHRRRIGAACAQFTSRSSESTPGARSDQVGAEDSDSNR